MKLNSKTVNIAAGIVFLGQAIWIALSLIQMFPYFDIIPPTRLMLYLAEDLLGIPVLIILGVQALRQKKRGNVLNILFLIYYSFTIGIRIGSLTLSGLVPILILAAAFALTKNAENGTLFKVLDTTSEAAKAQAQTMQQNSIYDEQLKAGILTQEEYDQIMRQQSQSRQ